MSALDLGRHDLAVARSLIVDALAQLTRAAGHVQAARDLQPRDRKGRLSPGALNVWGLQNALTSMAAAGRRAQLTLDRWLTEEDAAA